MVHNTLTISKDVNLQMIEKCLLEGEMTLDEVGEAIPAIFYVISSDLTIQYLNPAGRKWLQKDQSEIAGGQVSITSYYHPDTAQIAFEQMNRFYNLHNPYDIQYDIQKVWYPGSNEYQLCLITTKFSLSQDGLLSAVVPLKELPHLQQRMAVAAK